jgi:MFS transporter, FHS family, L-fucose permease
MKQEQISIENAASLSKRDTTISILIIGVLFFIFGFVTWVNSILIPYFKISCQLTSFQSYLVAFTFYISYLIFSVPASYLLKKVGFKKGMMIGFWIMSVGTFLFVPAALSRNYLIFLIGLFTMGSGLALLQTASNPYITILGAKESAAQRINIMGICNKVAGILAPLIFAAVILKSTDADLFKQIPLMAADVKNAALDALIQRVIVPYSIVTFVLIGLGIMIRFSPLPEIDTETESPQLEKANADKKSIFQFPHLILGAIAGFFDVGIIVLAVDTIIGYANSMHIPLMEAKVFPSYALAASIFGKVLGIFTIPKFISQLNALRLCTILGLAFSISIIFTHGQVQFLGHDADISIWFLVLLGFACSIVWSLIWPLALEGLGRFTKLGASVLIMGLSGNAVMPLIYGHFADVFNVHAAYWVLIPCNLYMVFYAFYGYRVRSWSFSKKTVPKTL